MSNTGATSDDSFCDSDEDKKDPEVDKTGLAKKAGTSGGVAKKGVKEKKKVTETTTPVSKKKEDKTRLSRALSRDSASSLERKKQDRKTRSSSHSAQKPKVCEMTLKLFNNKTEISQ